MKKLLLTAALCFWGLSNTNQAFGTDYTDINENQIVKSCVRNILDAESSLRLIEMVCKKPKADSTQESNIIFYNIILNTLKPFYNAYIIEKQRILSNLILNNHDLSNRWTNIQKIEIRRSKKLDTVDVFMPGLTLPSLTNNPDSILIQKPCETCILSLSR